MSDYLKYCSEDAYNTLETSASFPAIPRERCEPMIAHGAGPSAPRSRPPSYLKSSNAPTVVWAVERVVDCLGCNTISVWSTRRLAEKEVKRLDTDGGQFMITSWVVDEGEDL